MSKIKHRVLALTVVVGLISGISWQVLAAGGGSGEPEPGSGSSGGVTTAQSAGHGSDIAASKKPPKKCSPPLACGDDLQAAIDLEARVLDNLWFGQLYEINYRDSTRTLGDVANAFSFGDSALWTGTYLAAESYRYALAKEYLSRKGLNREQRDFWAEQKADAKQRVDIMVAKYNILINISENWNHDFDPVSQTQPGFGGGVFAGEKGYLQRACNPADAPPTHTWTNLDSAQNPDPDKDEEAGTDGPFTGNRRVFGPLDWENEDGTITQYYCENGTSRDAYAGTTFGLLTAFDLVSQDDPEMRTQIRDDIISLVDFAVKYYWSTPRPHGRISLPLGLPNPPCSICGHDFENFISPLFVQVPMARLNMAKAAQHVANSAPGRDDVAKWEAVYAEELATQVPILALSMEFDAADAGHSGYYKYNLHHLTGFTIARLEQNPEINLAYKQAIGVMDHTTGDDINAHFETITFALTGEEGRFHSAVQHLREWREYRARIDLGGETLNSLNCGRSSSSIECVPLEQLAVSQAPADDTTVPVPPIDCKTWTDTATTVNDAFATATVILKEHGVLPPNQQPPKPVNARCRAADPLRVALRPPRDFLWQNPSTQLNGSISNTHQYPGVDYLLPYWMLRYYTEVEEPALEPFPPWVGPSHK